MRSSLSKLWTNHPTPDPTSHPQDFISNLVLKLHGLQKQEDLHNDGIELPQLHIYSSRSGSADREVLHWRWAPPDDPRLHHPEEARQENKHTHGAKRTRNSPRVFSAAAGVFFFSPLLTLSSSNQKWPEELYDLWFFFSRDSEKNMPLLRQVWAPLADRASLCSPLSVCTLNRDDFTVSAHTNTTTSGLELWHVFDFGLKKKPPVFLLPHLPHLVLFVLDFQ